jgi:hypothetical protein
MRGKLLVVLGLSACGPRLVPVVPNGDSPFGGTTAAASDPSFEVVARSAGVKDPLPVGGSNVVYANLEPALNNAVLRAVRPRHACILTVELVSADADYAHSRLAVSLVARATVRTREGNAFLAQTTVVCRDSAVVSPEVGSSVVWSCMARLGRDLGGWFEGLPATTPAP